MNLIRARKFKTNKYHIREISFAIPFSNIQHPLDMYFHDTLFSFGKYQGKSVYDVMCLGDYSYLIWVHWEIGKILFDKLVFYDIKICADITTELLKKLELRYNEKYLQYMEDEKRKPELRYPEQNYFEKEPNEFDDMCPYCLESPCRCSDPF